MKRGEQNKLEMKGSLFCSVMLLICVGAVLAKHEYKMRDEVPLNVNKVGPYANPSEAYEYYSLPLCRPQEIQHKHESLGEILSADRQKSSLYDLRFRVDIDWRSLCKVHLNREEIDKFINAVKGNYYYEMVYDELPIFGKIGFTKSKWVSTWSLGSSDDDNAKYYLFTHIDFLVEYNHDKIIHINASAPTTSAVDLPATDKDLTIEFSYSVHWQETKIPFEKRMDVYVENPFFSDLSVHWLSILNSLVLVGLLAAMLGLILIRVLKSDVARYSELADEEDQDEEEYGWKLLSGDVFRIPAYFSVFSSILGAGAQLLVLVTSILILSWFNVFSPYSRGSMYTAFVVIYALSNPVAGYVSASWYKKLGGEHWAFNIVLAAGIFFGPLVLVVSVLNTIAIAYGSSTALPFGTIVVLILLLVLVGAPLTVIGGIAGRHYASPYDPPSHVKHSPREIPSLAWFRQPLIQVPLLGFLPFSAICIELYYLFSSVWGHVPYTLFGILSIVFVILLVVTSVLSITMTYFQLQGEDWRWWWKSLLGGGYVFWPIKERVYYTNTSTSAHGMSGLMQAAYFFGYTAVICWGFALLLGFVAFLSSYVFVRKIYRAIKSD